MPTPRYHGGAALEHIPLTVPGFRGLNKEAERSILSPDWATRLENAIIDETNRVASRKGFTNSTAVALPSGAQFVQLVEYRQNDGTVELVGSADDDKLYSSVDDGSTWSDVTGTAVVTDSNMQFVNFNNKLVGAQEGGNPVLYTGTTFSDIVSGGDQPTGHVVLAGFGRIWAVNSTGVEVQYSALLNEGDWTTADSGVLSMENVWPESDSVVALAAFNNQLVVFGENNIVMITDGTGSELGIDPTQAYVVDTIGGIGCIARDSVANVKGDLWFLSRDGMQSLGRLIQERSNPLNNLSRPVQNFLLDAVTDPAIDLSNARAVFSPADRFYLLSLPRTATVAGTSMEVGRCFVFDTRGTLEDGSVRCLGIWTGLVPRAVVRRRNNSLLMAKTDVPGQVGLYQGYLDNGSSYEFIYESGWIDASNSQGYLIIPKRISGTFLVGISTTVTFKWAFDFSTLFSARSVTFSGTADPSAWGSAEYGIAEWGAGAVLKEAKVAATGTGEFVKLGIQATVDGGPIAIQQIDVFAKIGRLR